MNTEAARVLRRASKYIKEQLKSKEDFYPSLKNWWNIMDHKTRGKFKKTLLKTVKEKVEDKDSINTKVTDMFLCRSVTKIIFSTPGFYKWAKILKERQENPSKSRVKYEKHYKKSKKY